MRSTPGKTNFIHMPHRIHYVKHVHFLIIADCMNRNQSTAKRSTSSESDSSFMQETLFSPEDLVSRRYFGRSNVIFTRDMVDDTRLTIRFGETPEEVMDEDYNLREWSTMQPFSSKVRIVEYHLNDQKIFHLRQYSRAHVDFMLGKLQTLAEKYKFYALSRKTRGVIWKQRTKRQ